MRIELATLHPGDSQPAVGESVRLRISAQRLADAQPLVGLAPGAWLDRDISVLSGSVPVCGQRIAGLLSGDLMARPLVDLNGYFLLTLDAEGSLSVLDPSVDFAGRTSLYKTIPLGGVPFDWILLDDHSLVFVAIPDQREVVVVDLQSFEVAARIDTGYAPTRLAVSPDQRLLWVGTRVDHRQAVSQSVLETSSDQVVVIDTFEHEILARVDVPIGHHEFSFDDSLRQAWVSSRSSGMLSVVDLVSLELKTEINVGGQPLSLVHVPSVDILWVAEAEGGALIGLNPNGQVTARHVFEPGIGPVWLTPDEKSLLLLNPAEHRLYVLDADTGRELHAVTISGRPYDISFTESYAYVRTLDSSQLGLFDLSSLRSAPIPQTIPVGQRALSTFAALPIASSLAPTLARTGMFFGSPTERTLYHFMEGMNAPDKSIRTFGHTPIAIATVLRGLREIAPGRYETVFDLPTSGRLVLALALDTPILRECIPLDVIKQPETMVKEPALMQWLEGPVVEAQVGEPVTLRIHQQKQSGGNPKIVLMGGAGGKSAVWQSSRNTAEKDVFSATGVMDVAGSYFVYIKYEGDTLPAMGQLPATLRIIER